jgi:uncharacterized membrane protein YgcG
VTLRAYVHIAPPWIVLTVSGAASMAGAVAIRRWLVSGRAGERHGFTSEPLFTDERHRVVYEGTVTVATLASARTSPAESSPRFHGGGGRSGGAGATGDF